MYKHTFKGDNSVFIVKRFFLVSDIKSLLKVCFPLLFRLYSLLHLGGDNDQSISVHEGAEGVTAAWLARRSHISRIPNGGFHAVNFRQIMAHILHDTQPMYVISCIQTLYNNEIERGKGFNSLVLMTLIFNFSANQEAGIGWRPCFTAVSMLLMTAN